MQPIWNATFCCIINAGLSIEKKNKPQLKFVKLNWLFNLRQKHLFYHFDDSLDPKALDSNEVKVMVWPLEQYQVPGTLAGQGTN